MNAAKIGARIRDARIDSGKTLTEVANQVGVAVSTIQRYEAGNIEKIKLPVIESIANALNVNPEWIILKTDIKEPLRMFLLSEAERELIQQYRSMDQSGKDFIKTVIDREQNRKEK